MALLDQLKKQAKGYLGQLEGLQDQMKEYTPVDAGGALKDLQSRVGFFQPQYQELAGLTQQAAATPINLMKEYQRQYGGVAGPSAMDRLSQIQSQVGNIFGTREALSNALNAAGGNLSNIAQSAVNQYQAQQQGLQGQYDRKMELYRLALQQIDAEKARQAAAREAQLAYVARNQRQQIPTATTDPYADVEPAFVDLGGGRVQKLTGIDAYNYRQKMGRDQVSAGQAMSRADQNVSLLNRARQFIRGGGLSFFSNPLSSLGSNVGSYLRNNLFGR